MGNEGNWERQKKRSAERKRIIEKGYVAEAAVAAAAAATVAVKKIESQQAKGTKRECPSMEAVTLAVVANTQPSTIG